MRDHLRSTPRWFFVCAAVLVVAGLARLRMFAYTVFRQWPQARGYEYEWIAESLAQGHGYSFESERAWLGPYPAVDYSASAWVEPLHTLIMAGSFLLFGAHAQLVLVLLNVLWLGGAAVLIVLCCGRDRVHAGVLAALVFLLFQTYIAQPWLYIGNTALATFLFGVIALLLLRALERPSLRRTAALGAVIGAANLVHAGSLLFGAVSAAVLLLQFGFVRRAAWTHALLVVLVPLATIAPWTLRNYVVFREFVPIRTGFGWNLYMGNPALGLTLPQEAAAPGGPAPWQASGVSDAVQQLQQMQNERALRRHAMALALQRAPADFAAYNEAQRDAYFSSRATAWMRGNPDLAARFVLEKVRAFLFGWRWPVTVLTLLAVAGVMAHWRDPRAVALALLIAAYALPYALAMPFYYRYRTPIEPFMFVLATWLLTACIATGRRAALATDAAARS